MSDEKQIECKDLNCKSNHFWFEDLPDGRRMLCYHTKSNGVRHIAKIDLGNIVLQSINTHPPFARRMLASLQG